MVALEEGVLGASNWTGVFNSSAELDVLDYYEDFEVSRVRCTRFLLKQWVKASIQCARSLKNIILRYAEYTEFLSEKESKFNLFIIYKIAFQ